MSEYTPDTRKHSWETLSKYLKLFKTTSIQKRGYVNDF